MSDLPENWTETTIGKVVEKKVPQHMPLANEDFYYIDISSVDRIAKKIINPQKVSGKDAPSRARQVVAKGDVLVSMTRPNLNAVAIVSDDLDGQIASTGFDVLRAKDIESRWLYYLVRTNDFVTAMTDLVQGALYPAVRPRDIRDYEIPLAPLHEQKRIAEKLDQVLARVDACQSHLERVPQILKRFRQSVLAAATSGRLTEGWREEQGKYIKPWIDTIPENGVSLPEDYERLGKIAFKLTIIEHSAKDLPETWSLLTIADLYHNKTLIDFADGNHGAMYPRKEDFGDKGALFLTATQIGETWEVDIAACPRLRSDKAEKLVKGWSRKNDVLLTHNATVGRVGLLEFGEEDVLLGTSVTFYRFNENYISPNYGRILFSSPFFQDQLKMEMAQTTRNQVPITKQVSFNFICPPIEEQAEIVRRVEKLFAYAAKLEARYQSASEQVGRLTPSLLAKAFRGELVGQDPNDESASALVGKIRETRDAQKANPSVKSKKSKRS